MVVVPTISSIQQLLMSVVITIGKYFTAIIPKLMYLLCFASLVSEPQSLLLRMHAYELKQRGMGCFTIGGAVA